MPFLALWLAGAGVDGILWKTLLFVFLSGNVVYFLASIVPQRKRTNDAAHMLQCLRSPRQRQAQMHAFAYWVRSEKSRLDGDMRTAKKQLAEGRGLFPAEAYLRWHELLFALRERQWESVQATVRPLLEAPASRDALWYFAPLLVLANQQTGNAGDLRRRRR
jgi:hypothetical protein